MYFPFCLSNNFPMTLRVSPVYWYNYPLHTEYFGRNRRNLHLLCFLEKKAGTGTWPSNSIQIFLGHIVVHYYGTLPTHCFQCRSAWWWKATKKAQCYAVQYVSSKFFRWLLIIANAFSLIRWLSVLSGNRSLTNEYAIQQHSYNTTL